MWATPTTTTITGQHHYRPPQLNGSRLTSYLAEISRKIMSLMTVQSEVDGILLSDDIPFGSNIWLRASGIYRQVSNNKYKM